MEPVYKREINGSYLYINTTGSPDRQDYSSLMFAAAGIPGLLHCTTEYLDNETGYLYNVTSKVSVSSIISGGRADREIIRRILKNLFDSIESIEDYLLSCDHLLILPEYIFADPSGLKIYLCYCPVINRNFKKDMNSLMEFFMNHSPENDNETSILTFRLFRMTSGGNFSVRELKTLSMTTGRIIPKIQYPGLLH